jgi:hypothetical protein
MLAIGQMYGLALGTRRDATHRLPKGWGELTEKPGPVNRTASHDYLPAGFASFHRRGQVLGASKERCPRRARRGWFA